MKLRVYRLLKNLSRSSVAQKLGVIDSTVANWECHRTVPNNKYLLKIITLTEGAVMPIDFAENYNRAKKDWIVTFKNGITVPVRERSSVRAGVRAVHELLLEGLDGDDLRVISVEEKVHVNS